MQTREEALKRAKQRANATGERFAIYRVGPAWMYTRGSILETQAHYKVRIQDFEVVLPDVATRR